MVTLEKTEDLKTCCLFFRYFERYHPGPVVVQE